MYADTRYLFFSSVSIYARFSTAVLPAKADAKIQPFSIPTKYFFSLGSNLYANTLSVSVVKDEKKFALPSAGPRKTPPRTAKNAEITPLRAAICQQSTQVAAAPRVKPQKTAQKRCFRPARRAPARRGTARQDGQGRPHSAATPTFPYHFLTISILFPYYLTIELL